MAKFEVKVT